MGDFWCLHTVEALQEEAADDNQIKQLTAKRSGLNGLSNTVLLTMSYNILLFWAYQPFLGTYRLRHSGRSHHVPANNPTQGLRISS